MIISLNIVNADHVQHMFRRYSRAVYGLALPYNADCSYTGILSQGEDLFISGHGSPVSIGHQEGGQKGTGETSSQKEGGQESREEESYQKKGH